MSNLMIEEIISTNSFDNKIKEVKFSPVFIQSVINGVKTENFILGRAIVENSCNNPDDFKIMAALLYPEFKKKLSTSIRETAIESGVHYFFEDEFAEFFNKNPHMATFMLQRFLRENYTNIRMVKAVLHIISHYSFEEIGDYFIFPIASLINHENKGIKKFALKVFDNWDSTDTIEILRGTSTVKEHWLNDYKEKIIARLERKIPNAIFFTSY